MFQKRYRDILEITGVTLAFIKTSEKRNNGVLSHVVAKAGRKN